MSVTPAGAVAAPAIRLERRARAVALRTGLGALALLTLLTFSESTHPAPVAAGSSCTGWTSQVVPPRTIRVLRTGSGRIERVPFRRYVAEVMASGEWPSRLHMTTLEAGAVATKQYAWYYAMKGHHRPSFRSGSRCFDVRDDTMDQLYRPESARPSGRQQRAIDTTWGLTLRKYGRFFLTGYRAGVSAGCAVDANGWKLYARSVEACARQGWSRERVQRTYLGPNLSFVWSPRVGPILAEPLIGLRAGNTIPHRAVTVSWKPEVALAGVSSYTLQRQIGRRAWQTIPMSSPRAGKAHVWLKTGAQSRFRIRGTDTKGRTGPWAYSATRTADLRGPVGLRLASTRTVAARARNGWARVSLTGRSVAFVARTGPGMGIAKVFVNGRRAATVDLERPTVTDRELVWAVNFGAAKRRNLAVKAIGSGAQVDFQGFYVLR